MVPLIWPAKNRPEIALVSSEAFRPRGQFRVGRNNAEFLLTFQSYLAIAVPSGIKLAFEFVDPFFGHVVRGMSGPRRYVKKERPLRIDCLFALHPGDRVVREVV